MKTSFEHKGRKIRLSEFTYWRGYSDNSEHYRAKYKDKIIEATNIRDFRSKLIQLIDDEEAVEITEFI